MCNCLVDLRNKLRGDKMNCEEILMGTGTEMEYKEEAFKIGEIRSIDKAIGYIEEEIDTIREANCRFIKKCSRVK